MTSPSDKKSASVDDSSAVNLYIFRGDEAAECMLENCARSLTLSPATGEYAFDPVQRIWNRTDSRNFLSNTSAGGKVGDFALSMQQAFEHFPLLESVTIPYVFYANTSTTSATLRPGVTSKAVNFEAEDSPWQVGNRTRTTSSTVVVGDNLEPTYQYGTPSDASLKAAINWLHDRGKRVILQPIIAVNDGSGKDSRDITATSASQVAGFLDKYRVFMEHAKTLLDSTARAGITDSLIVGTGLGGISSYGAGASFKTYMSGVMLVLNQNKSYSLGLSSDIDQLPNVSPSLSHELAQFLAINYSPALGSWTDDESAQTAAQQAATSIYDLDYLRSQISVPSFTTALTSTQKILLHNIGCRSLHRAANAPDSLTPPAGNGNQDNLMQRAYIEAILSYFGNLPEYDLSRSSIRAWDIRLHSQIHVARPDDIPAWRTGFVLNGKVQPPPAPASKFGNYYYCNSDTDLVIDGRTYTSMQISGSDIKRIGEFSNKQQTLKLPRNSPVIKALRSGRHPTPITLTIKRGHLTTDSPGYTNFIPIWSGRVMGAGRVGHEVTIEGRAFSTGLSRIGVNRRYQHSCPHVLYDLGSCRATRNYVNQMAINTDGDNTIGLQTNSIAGLSAAAYNRLIAAELILNPSKTSLQVAQEMWANGSVSWEQVDNSVTPPVSTTIQARITKMEEQNGVILVHLARPAPNWGVDANGAPVQVPVKLLMGCNHMKVHCKQIHENIQNFGGQPNIPANNPFNIDSLNWW